MQLPPFANGYIEKEIPKHLLMIMIIIAYLSALNLPFLQHSHHHFSSNSIKSDNALS